MKKPLATKKSKVRVPDMTKPSKYKPNLFDSKRWSSDLDTCQKVRRNTTVDGIPEALSSMIHLDCDESRLTRSKTKFGIRFLTEDTMSEGR